MRPWFGTTGIRKRVTNNSMRKKLESALNTRHKPLEEKRKVNNLAEAELISGVFFQLFNFFWVLL